ncbi:hypothetical protein PM082_012289 [Marasmius tenuissimus]|nr:hypothetical protein PM082_012289 [Marasmius tenuissimus]
MGALLRIFLLVSLLFSSCSAQFVSSPTSIGLLVIPDVDHRKGIGPDTRLPIGLFESSENNNTYWGLRRYVNISVTYPNGTHRPLLGIGDASFVQCVGFSSGGGWGYANAVNGSFTAQWDVFYAMSADTSQIVVGESCGSGPLSFQNFTLKHTFDVLIDSQNKSPDVPRTLLRTVLGTQPTGSVLPRPSPTNGSGDRSSRMGMDGGYTVVITMSIMLCILAGISLVLA